MLSTRNEKTLDQGRRLVAPTGLEMRVVNPRP